MDTIERAFQIAIILFPMMYFWIFWLNPVTIKKILIKKGYTLDYVKSHLMKHYSAFYGWIPKLLLK